MPTETKRRLKPRLFIALAALLLGALLLFAVNRWQVVVTPREGTQTLVEYGASYADPGADALLQGSLFCTKGLPLAVETEGTADPLALGDYTVVYRARALFFRGQAERRVLVRDTTPPVIALVTAEGSHTRPGSAYVEEGYTATDAHDGDLTESVACFASESEVRYIVADSAGNRAEAVRPIVYADWAPTLTLAGESAMVIDAAPRFADPGYAADDDFDGDLTASVVFGGDFSPYHAGAWQRSYTVTDSAGQSAAAVRDIQVRPVPQPETVRPEGWVAYLTFDDGPGPNTERLLDLLDAYGVKATFFVTEVNKDYVNLIADIHARGHSLGVHTASHDYNAIYASEDAFFADFCRVQDLIYEQTGFRTTLLRFPGGSSNTSSAFNPGIMTRLTAAVGDMGLQYFDWNVTAADSAPDASYEAVVDNVISGIRDHDASVVLQHDTRGFSVDAVEAILIWGLEHGCTFLPLDPTSPTAHHGVNN